MDADEYMGSGAVDAAAGGLTRAVVVGPPASGSATTEVVGAEVVDGGRGTLTASLEGREEAGGCPVPLLRSTATASDVQKRTRIEAARAGVVQRRSVPIMGVSRRSEREEQEGHSSMSH